MKSVKRICTYILSTSGQYDYSKKVIDNMSQYVQKYELDLKTHGEVINVKPYIALIRKITDNICNPFIHYYFDETSHLLLIKTLNKSYIVIHRNVRQFRSWTSDRYLFNVMTKYDKCIPYFIVEGDTKEIPQFLFDCFPNATIDNVFADKLISALSDEPILDKNKQIYICPQVLATFCSINTFEATYRMFHTFATKRNVIIFNNSCNIYSELKNIIDKHMASNHEMRRFNHMNFAICLCENAKTSKKTLKHIEGYFTHFTDHRNQILIDFQYNHITFRDACQDSSVCCLPTNIQLCNSRAYFADYQTKTLCEKIMFLLYNNVLLMSFIILLYL